MSHLYSPSYLDHAVTVGIGDVRLQTREQGSVIMLEVKVLQSKFGVLYRDLIQDFRHIFHKLVIQSIKHRAIEMIVNVSLRTYLSVFFRHHVEVWLFITTYW